MKFKLLLLAVALALSGCNGLFTPEPSTIQQKDAVAAINSLKYIKANNGLCFGISAFGKLNTNGTYSENMVIVNVPCDKVGL